MKLEVPAYVRTRLEALLGKDCEISADTNWLGRKLFIQVQGRTRMGAEYEHRVTVRPANDENVLRAWRDVVRIVEADSRL